MGRKQTATTWKHQLLVNLDHADLLTVMEKGQYYLEPGLETNHLRILQRTFPKDITEL